MNDEYNGQNGTIWFNKKEHLPHTNFVLSRDCKVNQGCKQFTWFESPQKLIAFVNNLKTK
jgi:hypothetical protein